MTGIDIVYIPRMAKAVQSDRFIGEVFTAAERAYAEQKADAVQTYAGIFAAKEAVIKTFRQSRKDYKLTDVEILHDNGIPYAVLHGKLSSGYQISSLSITHDGDYAAALAASAPITLPSIGLGRELTAADVVFPRRLSCSHKGDYGRVYIIGGSAAMIGAPYLSAVAASRAGAGLVTLCVPQSLLPAYQKRVTEQTLMAMPDKGGCILPDKGVLDIIIAKADVVAIGPGMGANKNLAAVIAYICARLSGTLVIDADGLNAVAAAPACLNSKQCSLILTPHRGEFNRLYEGCSEAPPATAELALRLGAVVVNKSNETIISDGVHIAVNRAGTPSLAKGGSGDVLTGLTAALAAAFSPFKAACMAAYYFGKAGEAAAKEKGSESLIASEIPLFFKDVFLYEP